MAPPKRLLAFPAALASYALGWWGIAHASGLMGTLLPFFWVAAYFGVFWGGWVALPVLGVAATFMQPVLPERLRRPARQWFVGWLVAWLGVLAGLAWLGPPPGFDVVPI